MPSTCCPQSKFNFQNRGPIYLIKIGYFIWYGLLKEEDFTGCKAYLVTLIDIKKEQALFRTYSFS
tara:strand:- start:77 stop:271 length:195 start_codon:yes stop_codon:yes gene_type:complete